MTYIIIWEQQNCHFKYFYTIQQIRIVNESQKTQSERSLPQRQYEFEEKFSFGISIPDGRKKTVFG